MKDNEGNDFEMIWGQFLDHDLDRTLASSSRQSFATGNPASGNPVSSRRQSFATGNPVSSRRQSFATGIPVSSSRQSFATSNPCLQQ